MMITVLSINMNIYWFVAFQSSTKFLGEMAWVPGGIEHCIGFVLPGPAHCCHVCYRDVCDICFSLVVSLTVEFRLTPGVARLQAEE